MFDTKIKRIKKNTMQMHMEVANTYLQASNVFLTRPLFLILTLQICK
uniref:Uncharacterized protein n=1 Tax=Arundo donax TaxID=35708 RepID=A0A0A9GMR7_ARUDO